MKSIKIVMKKLIVSFLIVMIVISTSGFNYINAVSAEEEEEKVEGVLKTSFDIELGDFGIVDGILGIMCYGKRIMAGVSVKAIHIIISQLAGGGVDNFTLTPEDIVFSGSSREDKTSLVDINFFDTNPKKVEGALLVFREGVADWYYIIRNISIAASLVVLMYIVIRMIISTISTDEAKYKEMLKNWVVGFIALIFLHFFIILIISLNSKLVDMIYGMISNHNQREYTNVLFTAIFSPGLMVGMGSLILYILMIGVTIALFIMYLKRLFVVGFLIVIAPLITITYAVDKLGDGKSQALNTWGKEFIYNVLIQPFHCIIYCVLASSALSALDSNPSVGNFLFAGASVLFIFKAEEIIKKIFGIDNEAGAGGMLAAGAAFGSVMSKATSTSKKNASKTSSNKTNKNVSKDAKPKNLHRKDQPKNSNGSSNSNNSNNSNNSSSSGSSGTGMLSRFQNSNIVKGIKDEAVERKTEMKNRLEELKDKESRKKILKQAGKRYLSKNISMGASMGAKMFTGLVMAGATGKPIESAILAKNMENPKLYKDKIVDPLKKMDEKVKNEGKEGFKEARAWDNLKANLPEHVDPDIKTDPEKAYDYALGLLEEDLEDIADENEKEFARILQEQAEKFESLGDKTPNQSVMNNFERILNGEYKNNAVTLSIQRANRKISEAGLDSTTIEKIDDMKDEESSKEVIKDVKRNQGKKQAKALKSVLHAKRTSAFIGSDDYNKRDDDIKNNNPNNPNP